MKSQTKLMNNTEIKSFLATFFRPYRLQIIGASIALVVTATVTLAIGQAIKWLIDAGFGPAESISQFNWAIGIFLGLVVLLAGGTYARFYFVSWLGERVSADIAKTLYARVIQFNPSFFETHSSGEIQSRILTDTTVLQTITSTTISSALRNALLLIGGLVLLFISNLKLTLLVLSFIPIVLIPILFYGRRVRQLSNLGQSRIADVGSYLNETLGHIKTVQAYNHQYLDIERFNKLVETSFNVAKVRMKKRAWLITLVIMLIFGGIATMIWVGGQDVASGHISSGALAAFVFYAIIVAGSLGSLSEVYGELQRAGGAVERLAEIWKQNDSILLTQTHIVDTQPINEAHHSVPSNTIVAFKDIVFSYPSAPTKLVLDNITLEVKEGEKIALVGPTGAGKTTLFELLLRFYDPQSGEILVNNNNIQNLNPLILRDCFAIVSQEPQLFSGTVLENIAYGMPNASQLQIEEAAKAAYAQEFIEELPEKYATDIGNKGMRLSGGQKQRLVIARALLKNPKILLLDEATSSLDSKSEQAVHLALEKLMSGRTTLVIAHRLSTVINADRIIVLDKGKVISIGTHEKLIEACPLYANLAKIQFAH
jgi:ATP-binding cassette subfamily B protein